MKYASTTPKIINIMEDLISFAAYCPTDDSLLLAMEIGEFDYWLPTVQVAQTDSWQVIKEKIIEIFGIGMNINKILRLSKIWIPNHKMNFLNYIIFEISVPIDIRRKVKTPLGRYRGKILWATEADLNTLNNNNLLKSPELIHIISLARGQNVLPSNAAPEYNYHGNYIEINENCLITGKSTPGEQLVNSSGFDRKLQEAIYCSFMQNCFPAIYMNQNKFNEYVFGLGWDRCDFQQVFYAANSSNRNAISFREFLYFLAAVEPGTSPAGSPAELRCKFVFRFLDRERKNVLRRDDLKLFMMYLRKSKNMSLEDTKIDKEVTECYKMMNVPELSTLNLNQFLLKINELKLKGTLQIFRSPLGIEKYLSNSLYKTKPVKQINHTEGTSRMQPTQKNYEFAAHCITIKNQNTVIDSIASIEEALSSMTMRSPICSEVNRKRSIDYFGTKTKVNDLIKSIRYLSKLNKQIVPYSRLDSVKYLWGQVDSNVTANSIKELCVQVKELVKKEPRLLEIHSPVFIMGDLHGNINDLLQFERTLWPLGAGVNPSNLLFLGDFVDRGVFGVEVVAYLFSFKVLCPNKVNLIRGNHEIKRVQQMWTFETECRRKFGDKIYRSVFDAINDVFDHLPLAAVIDSKVFCCHGGIPPPWLCPTVIAINDIPVQLNNPQEQSSLAWELMWNDPIRGNIPENVTIELMANEGFAMNTRRGTGHVFSVEALEKFLLANKFTHLIRAHEVTDAGFNLQQKAKMFTIFSSSKYCNGANEAACILADHGKLRVFRITGSSVEGDIIKQQLKKY